MKIAVGTFKKPKLEGVREGAASCPYLRGEAVEILPAEAPSGVAAMPLSLDETMAGARNRARHLAGAGLGADWYVGVEGGTCRIGDKAYLFGTAYAQNSAGEGHFGFSPFVEVPAEVERRIYAGGEELGAVMGELSGRVGIASENGSMGAWTGDMLTRSHQFSLAFQAAIAPFFNEYYRNK